jgi:hypothetical protein
MINNPLIFKTMHNTQYDCNYVERKNYKRNRDYTLKIAKSHKQIGEYKITVKFKGNYKGTVKKTFKIYTRPVTKAKTKTLSTSAIKVSWSKVKNVSGYKIYRYNSKKDKYTLYTTTTKRSCIIKKSSSDDIDVLFKIVTYKIVGNKKINNISYKDYWGYEYVKLTAPKFTISKKDFAEFVVKLKTYGRYEVQACKNKKFESNYTDNLLKYRGFTDSVRCYNLTSGTKYYVRVRRYIYDKNDNLKVSPWSKVKVVVPY